MSHYFVLVLLKREELSRLGDVLEARMAPFQEADWGDGGKWDWYQIGGRWAGALVDDYDPNTDPENIETCNLCEGTGTRVVPCTVPSAMEPGNCNGCQGKGKRPVWPTQRKEHPRDVQPVRTLIEHGPAGDKPKVTPFAVLDTEGTWHEKGQMRMFALVENAQPLEHWEMDVLQLYRNNLDNVAVVVDCHV